MQSTRQAANRWPLLTLLVWAFSTGTGFAFPPAPHHTLYGLVKNQFGEPLDTKGADVFLQTPSGVELRGSLVGDLEPSVNYRLEVPMDSGTTSDLYRPTALRPFFAFKLKVIIGQTAYLPIEMAGDFSQIGQPGQKTRIDLTLGVDSDGDGLPDAWEQGLIAVYGGTLSTIRPGDDSDGDGITNLDEYLAGTYAFDPADGFRLALTGFSATGSRLEFTALRGRSYLIQASPDLQRWTPVQFQLLGGTGTPALVEGYRSPDVRLLRVEIPFQAGGETNRYFRARVQ